MSCSFPKGRRHAARFWTLLLLPLMVAVGCDDRAATGVADLRPQMAPGGSTPTIQFTVTNEAGDPVPNAWVALYDGAKKPILQKADGSGVATFTQANGSYGFTVREIAPQWLGIRELVPPGSSLVPTGTFFGNLSAVVCAKNGILPFAVADYDACIKNLYLKHNGPATKVSVVLPTAGARNVKVLGLDGAPLSNANVYLVEKIPAIVVPWKPALGAGVEVGFFKHFARTDVNGNTVLPGTKGQLEVYEVRNGFEIAGTLENVPGGTSAQTVSTAPVVCIAPGTDPAEYSATYATGGVSGIDFQSSMWAYLGTRGTVMDAVLPSNSGGAVALKFAGTGSFNWQFRVRTGMGTQTASAQLSCVDGLCSAPIINLPGATSPLTLSVYQPVPGKLFAVLGGIPAGAETTWSARATGDGVPESSRAGTADSHHLFRTYSTCSVALSFDGSIWCDT